MFFLIKSDFVLNLFFLVKSHLVHHLLTHLKAEPSPPPPAGPEANADPAPASHTVSIRLAPPEKFSGESHDCRPFLVNCSLHYSQLPTAFPTERSKVAFMISHLTGREAAWATAEWSRDSPICESLGQFTDSLTNIFDHTSPGREAARVLYKLSQGRRSVFDAFLNGLSDPIKDQLAPLELPVELDSVIAMSIRIDNRLAERKREKDRVALPYFHPRGHPYSSHSQETAMPRSSFLPSQRSASPNKAEEPMQLGRAKLSTEERRRRLLERRCFYCGQQGHLCSGCPVKDGAHQ